MYRITIECLLMSMGNEFLADRVCVSSIMNSNKIKKLLSMVLRPNGNSTPLKNGEEGTQWVRSHVDAWFVFNVAQNLKNPTPSISLKALPLSAIWLFRVITCLFL